MVNQLRIISARVVDRPDGVTVRNATAEDMIRLEELLRFAAEIAARKTDAELDGDMSGDDAVSALSGLIYTARAIMGGPDGQA